MDKYEQYIGMVLENRYRLTELVGKGGMAVVFKAVDISMNRTVAVKILSEENNDDEIAVKRFFTESKAIAMLSHPNIVAIYDVSPQNSQIKFIIMEYIDGVTLKDYLDRKGAIDWNESCHYMVQILSALQHAHAKGVIHRDIKPQNIMLLADGTIKVTDFGIAKISNAPSVTATDKAIGTANYISPEQASGRAVDFHSDIYSVGVMLYEMITGCLPFSAESTVSVAMMHVHDEPALPSEVSKKQDNVPRGLEQIILKAMNKEPKERFGSANSMQKAIEYLMANPTIRFTERKKQVHNDEDVVNTPNAEKEQKSAVKHDNSKRKKKKKTTSMLPIVAGVTFAFLIVVLVCAVKLVVDFARPSDTTKNEVQIPNLVGEIYTKDLENDLAQQNYNVKIEYTNNREAKKGQIINQLPEKHSRKKMTPSGIDLTIYVNRGDEDVSIKNYAVVTLYDARLELEALGLHVLTVEEYHDTIISGYVIRTEPQYGSHLVAGDNITLYVSKGQNITPIPMPSVEDMTYDEAEKLLIDKGIAIGERIYMPSEKDEGVVIGTSIEVGEEIYPRKTTVDIHISKGAIIMPKLIGETLDDAIALLEKSGLSVAKQSFIADKAPENTVISTSVEAGTKLIEEENMGIDLVVSLGPTVMPELSGEAYDVAITKLYALGFYFIDNVEVESNDVPPGHIVTTSIPAGTSLIEPESSITVYISKSPQESQAVDQEESVEITIFSNSFPIESGE